MQTYNFLRGRNAGQRLSYLLPVVYVNEVHERNQVLGQVNEAGSIGDLPLLWVHGADDQLVPIDNSQIGFDTIKGSGLTRAISYPGARHEIFNETNQVEVLADVADFIEEVVE